MKKLIYWFVFALFILGMYLAVKRFFFSSSTVPANQKSPNTNKVINIPNQYPVHQGITATIFWVGEEAGSANDYITNKVSAWDQDWQAHFGGADNPNNRNGYLPKDFTPKENPFYFALPYDDFDDQGARKPDAFDIVYWATEKNWGPQESMCKNRWIKITKDYRTVFAQWEDVGPFKSNDSEYVFGNSAPKNDTNDGAGLDVSPAVRDYLGLDGMSMVDWQFVAEKDVPDGPWKQIVTTNNQGSVY